MIYPYLFLKVFIFFISSCLLSSSNLVMVPSSTRNNGGDQLDKCDKEDWNSRRIWFSPSIFFLPNSIFHFGHFPKSLVIWLSNSYGPIKIFSKLLVSSLICLTLTLTQPTGLFYFIHVFLSSCTSCISYPLKSVAYHAYHIFLRTLFECMFTVTCLMC